MYFTSYIILMISVRQIKAARSMLNWSANDLAIKSGIGVASIRRYEMQYDIPSANAKNIHQLIKVFNDAGIEFIGDPLKSPGVILHKYAK
jgi:DNA-binding transcriptional regulator YiaG